MNPFGDDDYARGPALRAELDQLTVQHRVLRLDRDGLYKRFVKLEEENERLRGALTNAQGAHQETVGELQRLRAELDWFRRREPFMRHPNLTVSDEFSAWLRANPKPGADT